MEDDVLDIAEATAKIQQFARDLAAMQLRFGIALQLAVGREHPKIVVCDGYRLRIVPDDLGEL